MPERFVVQPRTVTVPRPPAPLSSRNARSTADSQAEIARTPQPGASSAPPIVARHPALEPLGPYLDDPEVTDLFVNGESGLFVDRGRGAAPAAEWRAREEDVRDLAVALIGLGGRHIDDASPCVDARLENGIRVHAVLPPVAADGTAISIRVPRLDAPDLAA